jgi:hypothetical protein
MKVIHMITLLQWLLGSRRQFEIRAFYQHPFDACLDQPFHVTLPARNATAALRAFWRRERRQGNDLRAITVLGVLPA